MRPARDAGMTGVWAERLVRDGAVTAGVRWQTDAVGTATSEIVGAEAQAGDLRLGLVVPGFGNAHSHAFHRALRGRTHADGGTFWSWRERMYAIADQLEPDSYRRLASAVFAEQLASGWTALGEFHYVHHRRDGVPYVDHDMEVALADAAMEAGLRLVLLDTVYLQGGADIPLTSSQRRFGDGSAERWLERWHALRERLAGHGPLVTLGAAVHSVRAVPPDALRTVAAGLPDSVPLHVHLSEQPVENEASLTAYGLTPTGVLAEAGLLSSRLSVVHATHLTDADIALLGATRVHAVICPTTEADLGDGIGPARALADAGARLAVGSDQHAVVDPLLELRALEHGERLRSLARGRFDPGELLAIGSAGGYAALGLSAPGRVGGSLDLVELDTGSARTAGSDPRQLAVTATAADVLRTVVGGRVAASADDAPGIGAALARVLAEL